jgi:16S rRNA (cytidine1402-2'-O)-methyltransferase
MFEEVKRGTLAEVAEWARDEVRGEIVVVIGGAPARASVTMQDALAEVARLTLRGTGLKEASAQVAELTGLSKRDLYQGALATRPKI